MSDPGAILGWLLAVIGMALIVEPIACNVWLCLLDRRTAR